MMTESMSLSFRVEDSVAGAGVGWGVGVREAWVPLHPRKGSRVPDKAECLLFCKSGTFLRKCMVFLEVYPLSLAAAQTPVHPGVISTKQLS